MKFQLEEFPLFTKHHTFNENIIIIYIYIYISQSFSTRAILTLLLLELHCRKGRSPPEQQRSGFDPSADLRLNI